MMEHDFADDLRGPDPSPDDEYDPRLFALLLAFMVIAASAGGLIWWGL